MDNPKDSEFGIADWQRLIRSIGEDPSRQGLHETPGRVSRAWAQEVPCEQAGYRELLAEMPAVLSAFFSLAPGAVDLIRAHVLRTVRGMAGFVARVNGGELRLRDIPDLQAYCYVVAGIVGELLTELFLRERHGLAPAAGRLRERARSFGEGLQLVNILKDSASDSVQGRIYLPDGVERAEVLALARRNLETAAEYVHTLQDAGAERGVVAFTALPVRLAYATLDRVEVSGPGSKLTRHEVYAILQRLHQALDRNEPALSTAGGNPEPAAEPGSAPFLPGL